MRPHVTVKQTFPTTGGGTSAQLLQRTSLPQLAAPPKPRSFPIVVQDITP